jgi:hypothetical protein
MSANPNPQGKGLVPILSVLAEGKRAVDHAPPKEIDQISVELFTSLFILQSDFKFRPVPGKTYTLYQKHDRFWLSLVAPHQWDTTVSGKVVGECQLHRDMTWTLKLSEDASEDAALMDYIENKRRQFDERIQNAETMEDILPEYDESLVFYQRAYSHALAHSLRSSMRRAGIAALPFSEAASPHRRALEPVKNREPVT